ncbi:MAG: Maf family protein [bacterium]
MKLILGSSSKSRQQVLRDAGIEFDVLVADIDEKAIRDPDPAKLVIKLAHAKADAIVDKIDEPAILITSDQVVVWNGEIREKPESAAEAREWLAKYHSHPMEIVNGVVVVNTAINDRAEGIDIVKVYFKPIASEAIEQAISMEKIMYCSGAMRVEDEPLCNFVDHIDGPQDSTSGMPLELMQRLIKEVS